MARNIQVFTYKIDLAISSLSNANKARHLYDVKLIKTAGLDSHQPALPSAPHSAGSSATSPCMLGRSRAPLHAHCLPACLPQDMRPVSQLASALRQEPTGNCPLTSYIHSFGFTPVSTYKFFKKKKIKFLNFGTPKLKQL